MSAYDPPSGYTWPSPTGTGPVVGFTDVSFQQIRAVRRSFIGALIASDGQITTGYDLDNNPIQEYAYGVAVADEAADGYGIMVAAFSTQSERRQYIIDNASAWLP